MASTSPATTAARKPSARAAAKKPAAKPASKPAAKPAAAPAPKPAAARPEASKPPKIKAKLVRDSFTMPQADFDLIAALKARALEFKRPAKKSELLRAGLHVLVALNDAALHAALERLVPLKPGRPKKGG